MNTKKTIGLILICIVILLWGICIGIGIAAALPSYTLVTNTATLTVGWLCFLIGIFVFLVTS